MKLVRFKRPLFVAAVGLLLLGLSGRVDLSSPFIRAIACPGKPSRYETLGCTEFQANELIIFVLFVVVVIIGWSYFDKRKK